MTKTSVKAAFIAVVPAGVPIEGSKALLAGLEARHLQLHSLPLAACAAKGPRAQEQRVLVVMKTMTQVGRCSMIAS